MSRAERVSTKEHRRSDAAVCRANGWTVGTVLVGDEGHGPTIIELTAVGDRRILARRLAHNGIAVQADESSWVLYCRDWQEYGGEVPAPLPAGTGVVVAARRRFATDPMERFDGIIENGPNAYGLYTVRVPSEDKAVLLSPSNIGTAEQPPSVLLGPPAREDS